MDVDLRALIGKLDRTCHRALEAAAGLCLSRTNHNVEIEHWLYKLNEDNNADLAHIWREFEISSDAVNAGLTRILDRLKTGNSRAPSIAQNLFEAVKSAWLVSTVDFGWGRIRSGSLLLAMLSDSQMAGQLRDAIRDLGKISPSDLKKRLPSIVAGSSEESEMIADPASAPSGAADAPTGAARAGSKTPSLDQYTVDLTDAARKGKIDPVLGRDREIRQIVDILTRRRQNNPILTGEAGVGKTAVVEGFALRIAAADVPASLQKVSLRSLDLGLLQAGAGVKGEFENRLKSVIEEVKSSPTPIVLFIDEAHTMIGAGGQQGQGDAANLLKPALARGELRTIAATTWAEYKKYFEKDAALARRFQVVKVEEPDEDNAVRMMRGLTDMLERHHGVSILDEAVIASVKLSARYITGRQLPDKSVSLLDTSCARVAISQHTSPPVIEDLERRQTLLETERNILRGEIATGTDHRDRLADVVKELSEVGAELDRLKSQWDREKTLVNDIRDARATLRRHALKEDARSVEESPPGEKGELTEEEAQTLREKLSRLNIDLKSVQGKDPLLQPCVDSQTIAEVISGWTGIPVGRMLTDEIQTVLKLETLLRERVIGQDHGLLAIARRIQTSRANMDDPRKPIGVFMLVGPSGVGKTETAIALAELLYGGERNMVTINMSEFQEAHTVSSLKGSPPGYVGYGEGGVLTEAVRRKPYSVVLLDEVEKAHPDVMELFFQVFDKGVLEDGEGREIDFKNTVLLLTSNVATDTIVTLCADPDTRPEPSELALAIRPELEKVFPPALLGRLVVTPYFPLADQVMKDIIRLKLGKIVRRVRENHRIPLTYDEGLVDEVASRCQEVSSGARNVDHILANTLLPELAREFLARLASGDAANAVHVGVGAEGAFTYQFS